MRYFCAALIAGLAAAPAASAEKVLAPGRTLVWSADKYPGVARFRSGPLRIEIRPVRNEEGLVGPRVVVSQPGRAAATLEGERSGLSFESRITAGRWNRAGDLYLMLESYTGGMHCCDHVQIAAPSPGRFELVDLGAYDGDRLAERPSDVDGDGVLDFVVSDDRFLYAFSSYAESVAPTQFLNIVGGKAVDVSARPGFRPRYERLMARLARSCSPRRKDDASNGACAAYVAAAARAGRFDAAWADMLQAYDRSGNSAVWLPTECRVALSEGECPEAETIRYSTFPEALRAFLIRNGYIAR
jgi:hypothetical protein